MKLSRAYFCMGPPTETAPSFIHAPAKWSVRFASLKNASRWLKHLRSFPLSTTTGCSYSTFNLCLMFAAQEVLAGDEKCIHVSDDG